jgi:uncharacterized membrane protein YgdD (TMEM256/DUF423 family)
LWRLIALKTYTFEMTLKVFALSAASAVVLGAMGAHALQDRFVGDKGAEYWQKASTYHMFASVGLALVNRAPRPSLSTKLFLTSIALFSGSLYTMALTGERRLGAVTPIGGLSLIAAFLSLGFRFPFPK